MLEIQNPRRRRTRVGKVIPEKSDDSEVVGWTIRTTKGLLRWIDEKAKREKYTRNEVAKLMLEFAQAEEEASAKKGGGR